MFSEGEPRRGWGEDRPRLEAGTGVEVPVVLGQEVHVVEYEAVPGKVLHGLHKANV